MDATILPTVLPGAAEMGQPGAAAPDISESQTAEIPTQTTPTITPSPTLVPAPRQLTTGGCCTQPFWSPDSQSVLYIDKPSAEAPAGLWAAPLDGSPSRLVTGRLGIFSPDLSLVAYPERGQTIVERLSDGQRWTIPSKGRAISFSPDNARVAWTEVQSSLPFDLSARGIWSSRVDGSEAQLMVEVYGGGFAGWLSGGRMLVNGRLDPAELDQSLWVISPDEQASREVLRASRLRGMLLSPDSEWLAYTVVFDLDQAKNGLWLARLSTGERYRLDTFGSFRWRDAHRLLVVPLDLDQSQHRLWEFDTRHPVDRIASGTPLTDPALTPFRIANGDWNPSPDGRFVAYVSAEDHNLWVFQLPGD